MRPIIATRQHLRRTRSSAPTTDFLAPTRSASEGAARTSGHGLWVGSSRTRTANQGSALRPAGVCSTPSRTPRRPASPSQPAPAAERRSVSAGQPGCGAPRRNRTGDVILTMEPPGTAVRTPFPQVPLDRRGRSYRFSQRSLMGSLVPIGSIRPQSISCQFSKRSLGILLGGWIAKDIPAAEPLTRCVQKPLSAIRVALLSEAQPSATDLHRPR
jgi:hypothetical protein